MRYFSPFILAILLASGLFALGLAQSAAAEDCLPLAADAARTLATDWSQSTIDLNALIHLACDDKKPRPLIEMLSICVSEFDMQILDLENAAAMKEEDHPGIGKYKTGLNSSLQAFKKSGPQDRSAAGVREAALFIAPFDTPSGFENADQRPYNTRPLMLIQKMSSRGVLLHEFVHYLLWKGSKKRTEMYHDRQQTPRSVLVAKRREAADKFFEIVGDDKRVLQPAIDKDVLAYLPPYGAMLLAGLRSSAFSDGEEIDVVYALLRLRKNLGLTESERNAQGNYGMQRLAILNQDIRTEGYDGPLAKVLLARVKDLPEDGQKIVATYLQEYEVVFNKLKGVANLLPSLATQ